MPMKRGLSKKQIWLNVYKWSLWYTHSVLIEITMDKINYPLSRRQIVFSHVK